MRSRGDNRSRRDFRDLAPRRERHAPEGFTEALREVWLAPKRFFKHLDPEGGLLRPAIFAAAIMFLNLVLGDLLQAAWLLDFNLELLLRLPLTALVVSVFLGPALAALFAGLVLFVLDGAPSKQRFGPAFRAMGYVSGIGAVLWIPFAPLVAVPYAAYVAHIAVMERLGANQQQAAASVLIPLGALLVILFLLSGGDELWSLFINPPQS